MILSILLLVLVIYIAVALIGMVFGFAGLIISLGFYLCIRLPFAALMLALGLVLCCTIIGIPLGVACFHAAGSAAMPG
jgi:hypothetical protein